jgi:hypothetical protein
VDFRGRPLRTNAAMYHMYCLTVSYQHVSKTLPDVKLCRMVMIRLPNTMVHVQLCFFASHLVGYAGYD